MRFLPLAAALSVLLLLTACNDRDEPGRTATPADTGAIAGTAAAPPSATATSPASATPPTPAPTVVRSSPTASAGGCTLEAGLSGRTLISGQVQRGYRVYVPAAAAPGAPVVLNFHGLGSSAREQEPYSGLVAVADREGFILVTPDGTGSPRGWASFSFAPTGTDDVQFVRDLIEALATDLCIDRSRVYATGISNGGFMSSRLACELSDQVAAIGPVAGTHFPGNCGRPVPVLAFHGTADAVVPYGRGVILSLIPYPGVEAAMAQWAAHNGCEGEPAVERASPSVRRLVYQGCAAETVLYAVEGGGHTWPGAVPVPRLGPTTDEISAAELLWGFFAGKRLP